ncbi:putative nucleoporin [Dioscorea sansibarensis]
MGAKDMTEDKDDRSSDTEKEVKHGKEGESDLESARDSVSSQGEPQNVEDSKVKRASRVPKKLTQKQSVESGPRASRNNSNHKDSAKLQYKTSPIGQNKSQKPKKAVPTPKSLNGKKSESMIVPAKPPSEVSEGSDDKTIEEVKEIDVLDETPSYDQSIVSDDETGETENTLDDDRVSAYKKIEDMELRIDKLEEELREVAALEISLYSVVPEHGSSSHKVHTPARRLSRLYIHACKHWSQDKRVTVARNTVSGLVLIAKSCGSDISRLTFWLSNTVVLREIISHTFDHLSNSHSSSRAVEPNDGAKKVEGIPSPVGWKNSIGSRQKRKPSFMQQIDDWQETSTFLLALEKIESWIFSRTVESVWWQSFTPHMHSLSEDFYATESFGKLLGPALGDQQQGSFSINIWKSAFHDAFTRICPVRAGGHECGCLPVLARKVMEQCVSRLDVAMFNAILRESANEIPTDPVSDPIVDAKVVPIPAGNLSFGSGAQLKNSVGNWSRLLTDLFDMDTGDGTSDDQHEGDEEESKGRGYVEPKSFRLLNELSDLLMLPKDLLLDSAIRNEVCPSIGLSIVTRVLCNFTPDEFCTDPVAGYVLEDLNNESLTELGSAEKDVMNTFPRPAAGVVYTPPSPAEVAEKVAEIGGRAELERKASIVQKKGYTSDDDLDDLDSPLRSIVDKSKAGVETQRENTGLNARYKLLRDVWSG